MAVFAGLDVSQDKATICIVSDKGSSEEKGFGCRPSSSGEYWLGSQPDGEASGNEARAGTTGQAPHHRCMLVYTGWRGVLRRSFRWPSGPVSASRPPRAARGAPELVVGDAAVGRIAALFVKYDPDYREKIEVRRKRFEALGTASLRPSRGRRGHPLLAANLSRGQMAAWLHRMVATDRCPAR